MPSKAYVGRSPPARRWRGQSSAHRFLHERADPCLFGGGQLLQREGGWPHGAFVEVRLVAEAERRVPRLELLRALEEADRSEEHTSELQSRQYLVCRLLLEKKQHCRAIIVYWFSGYCKPT